MKVFFTFFLVVFNFFITNTNTCEDVPKVRAIFQSDVNEKELDEMILICEASSCNETIPYHAAALMKKAEFVWSPLKKLSNFKKGKNKLENFILENPKNIEARYIRWLTQKMAPSFLGYTENLSEDYEFIQQNLKNSDINDNYKKVILQHIKKIKNE